jgi:hypothetical protein
MIIFEPYTRATITERRGAGAGRIDIVPLSRAGALATLVKYLVVGLGVYQGLAFLLERGPRDLAGKSGVTASRLYSSCRLLARALAFSFVLGRDNQKNTRCMLEFRPASR